MTLNGATFIFHALVSRILGPNSYGALGTLTAAAVIVSIPLSSLQIAVTHEVARVHDRYSARHLELVGAVAAAATMAIAVAAAPALKSFLHLPSVWPVVMIGAYLAALVLEVVPRGLLIGRRQFAAVGGSVLADAALRVGLGVVLADVQGATGALCGLAAGEMVAAIWQLLATRRAHRKMRDQERLGSIWRASAWSVVGFTGFFALTSVDTVAVRHLLGATDSGLYAAASTAAGIAFFLPSSVTLALLPRLLKLGDPAGRPTSWRLPFAAIAALSAAPALALALAPALTIRILFGAAYLRARGPLQILSVSYATLGISYFLLNWELARRSRARSLPWLAAGVMVAAVALDHGTITRVAADVLLANGCLLSCLLIRARRIVIPATQRRRCTRDVTNQLVVSVD